MINTRWECVTFQHEITTITSGRYDSNSFYLFSSLHWSCNWACNSRIKISSLLSIFGINFIKENYEKKGSSTVLTHTYTHTHHREWMIRVYYFELLWIMDLAFLLWHGAGAVAAASQTHKHTHTLTYTYTTAISVNQNHFSMDHVRSV